MNPENIIKLRKTRVFQGLTEKDAKTVFEFVRMRELDLEKDDILAEEGSLGHGFFYLVSGRVQGVRCQANGSRDLVQIFTPGEIIGLDVVCSTTRRCPFRLSALEDGMAVFVEYKSMFSTEIPEKIIKKLRNNITQSIANESIRHLHKIDMLYRRHLRSRISVYLRNVSIMRGSRDFRIEMDREQFAQYLGVNRSALSHELAEMRTENLIYFRKNHFIILADEIMG
jgi:CRP-like cAMP-binding protein